MNKHIKNIIFPKSTSPLSVWLHYIEHLHIKSIDLGLDRVRKIATNMNLLRPASWIITVCGTNGKGTTCRLLETILLANRMRVGVYSSPHLLRYTERVRIQGYELPESAYSKAMAIIEAGRGTISLSYFEFSTLTALQLFQQAALDVVILEVGLGGRLDATNIIDADVAVMTSIAIEHTELLGLNRANIAQEKAGIFRSGKPAVVGELDRPETIDDVASNCGAILYARNRDWWWKDHGQHWHWWDKNMCNLSKLPIPRIPLENAATALAVIASLPFVVPESAVHQGLYEASLLGRMQCIAQAPLTILDVAHNPHAAGYLSQYLASLSFQGKIRAIVGMLADKDISGTLTCLHKQVDFWYCASLEGPRAASASQLAVHLNNNTQQFKDVPSAWNQAIKDSSPEDCILVFGSFYTVASILTLLEKEIYCERHMSKSISRDNFPYYPRFHYFTKSTKK